MKLNPTTNPKGAGRKKEFTVPTVKMSIPTILVGEVNELIKPFKTKKNV
jgi:hypothetical protein